eukprot:TRINITY_DN6884_c4_g1_i1.p1 TRINITY_DN6884_c4_g1~~TRINITY_DN6884_c4_g1_i1.p1  ORF type:complete len:4590 (+),score=1312.75 TRINITY_DN6884_c4_g1_i1:114-13772(+)
MGAPRGLLLGVAVLLGQSGSTRAQDEVYTPLVTLSSGWAPPVRWRRINTVVNQTNDPVHLFTQQPCYVRTSDCRRAKPTGQWWEPLILTKANATESEVVSALPLMLRARMPQCQIEFGPSVVDTAADGSQTAPFRSEVTVAYGAAGASFLAGGCHPRVARHDPFGVAVDWRPRKPQGGGNTEIMQLQLTRGHPYASVTLTTQVLRVSMRNGVRFLNRLPVNSSGIGVRAQFIDITDGQNSRWLLTLPQVHNVHCGPAGILRIDGTVNGTARLAHIPAPVSNGTVNNATGTGLASSTTAAAYDFLLTHSTCVATGGFVAHNHTATVPAGGHASINYLINWRSTPAGCTPLVVALPHHLQTHSSAPAAAKDAAGATALQYTTMYGPALGVVSSQWDLLVPLRTADATEDAIPTSTEPLCLRAKRYDALINDMKRNNGTARALDRNNPGGAVFMLAGMVAAARYVGADLYYRELLAQAQSWVDELLDVLLSYDDVWGLVCDGARANTDGEATPRECWGEGHLREYGALLHGLARLWPHLIQYAQSNRARVQNKLDSLARTIVRDIANPSERDEYFPLARGFDWYTGHAWDLAGIDPALPVRRAGYPGPPVTAYAGVALAGRQGLVGDVNMTRTGELLMSIQTASVEAYRIRPAADAADGNGVLTVQWSTNETALSDNLTALAPFGREKLALLQNVRGDTRPWVAALNQTRLAALNYSQTVDDVLILGVADKNAGMPTLVTTGILYGNGTLDSETEVKAVDWMVHIGADLTSTICPASSAYQLPIRVVGPTIWYNDSFNYLFKVIDYQPTLVGRKLSSFNIYDVTLYGKIHRRDLRLIKSLGFNTVRISTSFFTIDEFLELCAAFDLNVIIAQILPESGFSWGKYIAEDDFTTMLSYLSHHRNIVMWSIDSTALDSLSGKNVYDYYVLLRKLRLLRDVYDNGTRPIAVPFTVYTLANMTLDKDLYSLAVEVAELRTDMPRVSRLRSIMKDLGHPVIVSFFADSWHFVNSTDDEAYQAEFLGSTIRDLIPLHANQELAGLQVTEWSDQYWRGQNSGPDDDCPDPSAYRHSTCGYRRIEMYDGALTLEYMGINEQYQTVFRHCIKHKLSYYAVGRALNGSMLPASEDPNSDCIFLGLTDSTLWTIIIFCVIVMLCACGGAVHNCFRRDRFDDEELKADAPESNEQQWRQPNTEKIEAIVYYQTLTLLQHPAFAECDINPSAYDDEPQGIRRSSTGGLSFRSRSSFGGGGRRGSRMSVEDGTDVEYANEVDPKDYARWQVIQMQKNHLTKLIFDEMLCQLRFGHRRDVGEHKAGFDYAVNNLHIRYFNSYRGWRATQERYNALGSAPRETLWCLTYPEDPEDDGPYLPDALDATTAKEIESQRADGKSEFVIRVRGRQYFAHFHDSEGEPLSTKGELRSADDGGSELPGQEDRVEAYLERIEHPGALGETTFQKLVDLLALLTIWHLGEQMTWCCGHWLHWCFHYFVLHRRIPLTTIINDARHFQHRAVTFDDINESCVMVPYFDIKDTTGIDGQSGSNPHTGEEQQEALEAYAARRRELAAELDQRRQEVLARQEEGRRRRNEVSVGPWATEGERSYVRTVHALSEAEEAEDHERMREERQEGDTRLELERKFLEQRNTLARMFTRTSADALYSDKAQRFNEKEIERFPFRKTFREPLKAGVIMAMVHNTYYVVHTQLISFVFWAFVVSISAKDQKLADVGISGMFDRIEYVFTADAARDDLFTVFLVCSKVDFWIVLVNEIIDLWMVGGLYHCSKQDWQTTFLRVRLRDYVKMRWSAYTSMASFLGLIGIPELMGNSTDGMFIGIYVIIRVAGIVLCNIFIIFMPVRLIGSPAVERHRRATRRKIGDVLGQLLFWTLLYGSVQLFQAWVMFRTQTIDWDFCDCDNHYGDVLAGGVVNFLETTFGQMVDCFDEQPRCAAAVFLIWINAVLVFIVVVNAGFIVWSMLFGSYQHLVRQWESRKSRSLYGKKVETAFILRTLNIKMLGFTDPRDSSVARRVWNRVIYELWCEHLLSAFEYQNLLIYNYIDEIQFKVKNAFALERLGNFLEYIQATDTEQLGPPSTYPSTTIIIPVFNEDIMCPPQDSAGAFNSRIRDTLEQQEMTQLQFLIESYPDEWANFVEYSIVGGGQQHHGLAEDEYMFQVPLEYDNVGSGWARQIIDDRRRQRKMKDVKRKREMRGDHYLVKAAAELIADRVHIKPELFSAGEMLAVQWWASLRMQTVARTVRGMWRKHEAIQFLLTEEYQYTRAWKAPEEHEHEAAMMADDKVQILLALQNTANNRWYTKQEKMLKQLWSRFDKVQVTFPIDTQDIKNSPTVVKKVRDHIAEQWDCSTHLSCLAVWVKSVDDTRSQTSDGADDASGINGDWEVSQNYARRNKLRLEKKAKFGINGLQQGKAANQAHSMPFATGQLIQAIDCNQDGYFEECLKLRSVLTKFWPGPDRSNSEYKIVGFPEYSTTSKSGIVGRISSYSEYIFVNVSQKVMAHPLGVRMHYGHPDFFDKSWITTQGGMSKANPKINLNEDIFAGYHVTGSGEAVDHVEWMREGKGRETNFDGANGFHTKLSYGGSMQFRTRDQFELMRTSDVMRRHSIFFGSVGSYIYLVSIVFLIFSTMATNICLTFASKSDYELTSRGSPYGTEWMIQMSLVETVPLLVQLLLDFGVWGFFEWLWYVLPMTLFFLFLIMTKFTHFVHSSLSGSATYIATGRSDPLYRRSFRHMFRYYGHSHFMPGMLLFMLVWLYMDVETRTPASAFMRTIFHWGVGIGWIVTPCLFNPSLDFQGLVADLTRFYVWIFADKIPRVQEDQRKDFVTKYLSAKDNMIWHRAYDRMKKAYDKKHKREKQEQKQLQGSEPRTDSPMPMSKLDDQTRLLQERPPDAMQAKDLMRLKETAMKDEDFGSYIDDDAGEALIDDEDLVAVEFDVPDDIACGGIYHESRMPLPDDLSSLPATELLSARDSAVAREEFSEATQLRDEIRRRQTALEAEKQAAVDRDDFDTATQLKRELDVLRAGPSSGAPTYRSSQVASSRLSEGPAMERSRLEVLRVQAVQDENWDEAARLRDQIKLIDLTQRKEEALSAQDIVSAERYKQEADELRGRLMMPPVSSPAESAKPRPEARRSSGIHSGSFSQASAGSGMYQPGGVDLEEPVAGGARMEHSTSLGHPGLPIGPFGSGASWGGQMEDKSLSLAQSTGGFAYGSTSTGSRNPLPPTGAGSSPFRGDSGRVDPRRLQPFAEGSPGLMGARSSQAHSGFGSDVGDTERGSELGSADYGVSSDVPRKGFDVPALDLGRAHQERQHYMHPGAVTRRDQHYDPTAAITARREEHHLVKLKQDDDEKDDGGQDEVFDFDWLQKFTRTEDAKFDLFLEVFRALPQLRGEDPKPNTHLDRPGGSVPGKRVHIEDCIKGFEKLGKSGDTMANEAREYFQGLGQFEDHPDASADFVMFVVVFEKITGQTSGDKFGIKHAEKDVEHARKTELMQVARDMWRQQNTRHRRSHETLRQAVLTILHGMRREVRVGFRDSTADLNKVKAQSLKHLWKVEQVLGKRGCSTVGMFMLSVFFLGLWAFCYCALWQDVLWEVFYFVVAITWDYLLCLSQMRVITLVTRVAVTAFMIYRIILMLALTNVFYPTICLVYWLVHAVLEVELGFWACFGPIFLLRKVRPAQPTERQLKAQEKACFPGFASRPLDEQREACLIMLLRDDREQYLWGWAYYLVARQILACAVGLLQFVFSNLVLLIRTIIYFIQWVLQQVDAWQRRKNPTKITDAQNQKRIKKVLDVEQGWASYNKWTNTIAPDVAHKLVQVQDQWMDVDQGYTQFMMGPAAGATAMGPDAPQMFADLPPLPEMPPRPGDIGPQDMGDLDELDPIPPARSVPLGGSVRFPPGFRADQTTGRPPTHPAAPVVLGGPRSGASPSGRPPLPPVGLPTLSISEADRQALIDASADSLLSARAGPGAYVDVSKTGQKALETRTAGKRGVIVTSGPEGLTVQVDGGERVVLPPEEVAVVTAAGAGIPSAGDAVTEPPALLRQRGPGPQQPFAQPPDVEPLRVGCTARAAGPESRRQGVDNVTGRLVACDSTTVVMRFDTTQGGVEKRLPANEVSVSIDTGRSGPGFDWSTAGGDSSARESPTGSKLQHSASQSPSAARGRLGEPGDLVGRLGVLYSPAASTAPASARVPALSMPSPMAEAAENPLARAGLRLTDWSPRGPLVGEDCVTVGGSFSSARGIAPCKQGRVAAVDPGGQVLLRFIDGSEAMLPAGELRPTVLEEDTEHAPPGRGGSRRKSSTQLSDWGEQQAADMMPPGAAAAAAAPGPGDEPGSPGAGAEEDAGKYGQWKHVMLCIDKHGTHYPGWTPLQLLAKVTTDSEHPPAEQEAQPWDLLAGGGGERVRGGPDDRPVLVVDDIDGQLYLRPERQDGGSVRETGQRRRRPPGVTKEEHLYVFAADVGKRLKLQMPPASQRDGADIPRLREVLAQALEFRGPIDKVTLKWKDRNGHEAILWDDDTIPTDTTDNRPLVVTFAEEYGFREPGTRKSKVAERGDVRGKTSLEQRWT